MDPKLTMEQLVAELNKHNYQYYTLDAPVISDKEYDALYDQLVALEKETGMTLPDSPTQRVGESCSKDLSSIVIWLRCGAWIRPKISNSLAAGTQGL